ncbi:MAG: cytochrome c3 family protein [Cyanobacteria bacterium]|nr:cytochrome c3 family protein [Cyanobacteriota bacterium]
MKRLVLWFALIIAVGTASVLAMLHFTTASSALQQAVSPGPLSRGHAYLGDRCASCHQPTVGVTVTKCTACHANAERLLGRQPTAFHASIQECSACHVEHQGTNIRPVAMDHVALAKVGARTLRRASSTDAASDTTLKSLEKWLRIRVPDQLDASSVREALDCVGCHSTKDRHVGLFGKDCAQCHATTQWTVPEFQHPSPRSTSCGQCHQAPPSHYMMHFDMVSKKIAGQVDAQVAECCGPAQPYQCYRCHQTTSWNDIRGVGYYKHH